MEKEEREEIRKQVLTVLQNVWKNINWDSVSPSRRMKIYDEFLSRILVSANTDTVSGFVRNICGKWGIRALDDTKIIGIEQTVNSEDFLEVARSDARILVLRLRQMVDQKKLEMEAAKQ